MNKTWRQRLAERALPPMAVFVVFVLVWHAAVSALAVPPLLVPGPALVWQASVANSGPLLLALRLTGTAALCGLGLAIVVGSLVAFVFSQSLLIQRGFFPYAIFLQTVPVVAIAPLIIIWFGHGFQSVVVVAFILSLFPIITNGTAGLTQIDAGHRELFEIHNATRWQVLIKLRIPNAIPYLVTGARISSGLSVIGAIVGEFFAGFSQENRGLGYLIQLTHGQLRTAYLFAAILASTVLGLVIFSLVSWVGNLIMARWRDS